MNKRSIQFEKFKIHRVDDRVRRGEGFELADLSPGVTLIHGPNGSGKSTTALVIQELLWPGRTELGRPSAEGWYHDGSSAWHVDLDAGHLACVRDGSPGPVPDFGPPENRRRYRLALHELLQEDNTEFAEAIANVSQGGYDLAAAADSLGFRTKPKSRTGAQRQVQDRRGDLDKARRHQRAVEDDATKLIELDRQRVESTSAQQELAYLEKALEHFNLEERCQKIEIELATWPDGVTKLQGDERERLDEITARREERDRDQQREQQRVMDARAALAQANLPDGGLDSGLLRDLRASLQRLTKVEPEIGQRRQRLEEAKAEADRARQRLGKDVDLEQLKVFDTVEVADLSAFARQAARVRAGEQVLDERRRWLEVAEPEEIQGLDRQALHDGITALAQWLAAPTQTEKQTPKIPWLSLLGAATIVVLATVLILVHHWIWSLAGGLGVLLLTTDWWIRNRPKRDLGSDTGVFHRQSYVSTGLPEPAAWYVSPVSELLRRLTQLASARELTDERRHRLDDLATVAESIRKSKEQLEHQRLELEQRLGIEVQLHDEWLSLVVTNIIAWQRCHDDVAGEEHALGTLEAERRAILKTICKVIKRFGDEPIDSFESASLAVEELAARQGKYEQASRDMANASRRLVESVEPELERLEGTRRTIFARLDIREDEASRIDEWLDQRPTYLALKQELTTTKAVRDSCCEALSAHKHLLDLRGVELEQQIKAQRATADQRDVLITRIAQIHQTIADAKQGHEVSDALTAYEKARTQLSNSRAENCRNVIGAVLTDWVRHVAIDRSRPEVFRRANELLVKFTQGALRLNLDHRTNPPRFEAQGGSDSPRPIEHLSTGERVQLLMAVRIAFLEQNEPLRLPLLLDEALGTSDDDRAAVIIDSVIEIARQGRQIFCFTAQHGEICKWRARLETTGVAHSVIDLARLRRLATTQARPLKVRNIARPKPPDPAGMSYDDYGRALDVPGLGPATDNVDALHLWHLLEDAGSLHRLLCKNIVTWGQLRTLAAHGGATLLGAQEGELDCATIVARAIAAAFQAWRIGRIKSVDRAVIHESGCVTENFVHDVSVLAERLGGDGPELIAALENGQVRHWRTKNTERLRAYFEEHGFLLSDAPLELDEIRLRTMAAVADDLGAGRIKQDRVDRIIGMLPPYAPSQPTVTTMKATAAMDKIAYAPRIPS